MALILGGTVDFWRDIAGLLRVIFPNARLHSSRLQWYCDFLRQSMGLESKNSEGLIAESPAMTFHSSYYLHGRCIETISTSSLQVLFFDVHKKKQNCGSNLFVSPSHFTAFDPPPPCIRPPPSVRNLRWDPPPHKQVGAAPAPTAIAQGSSHWYQCRLGIAVGLNVRSFAAFSLEDALVEAPRRRW